MNLTGRTTPELIDLAADPARTAAELAEIWRISALYRWDPRAPTPSSVALVGAVLANPSITAEQYGRYLVQVYEKPVREDQTRWDEALARKERQLKVSTVSPILALAAQNPALELQLLISAGQTGEFFYPLLRVADWVVQAQEAMRDPVSKRTADTVLAPFVQRWGIIEPIVQVEPGKWRLQGWLNNAIHKVVDEAVREQFAPTDRREDSDVHAHAGYLVLSDDYLGALVAAQPKAKVWRPDPKIMEYARTYAPRLEPRPAPAAKPKGRGGKKPPALPPL